MAKPFTELMKMTPQEIFEYKNAWKPGYTVDVHSDLDVQCKHWCRTNLNRWEWSMDTYTDVYSHSFYFEHESHANDFTRKFSDWVNKGKRLMSEEQKKALDALAELSQEMEKNRKIYEHDNDTWWNGLTEEEREDAFYAVVKRIHKAEIEDRGTYRWALYDVFGFDAGMYMKGMDCGYMNLHNSIFDSNELAAMKRVNRFEVIDDKGRSYTKYLKDDERVRYELQDDDKTLKVFIDKVHKVKLEDL